MEPLFTAKENPDGTYDLEFDGTPDEFDAKMRANDVELLRRMQDVGNNMSSMMGLCHACMEPIDRNVKIHPACKKESDEWDAENRRKIQGQTHWKGHKLP